MASQKSQNGGGGTRNGISYNISQQLHFNMERFKSQNKLRKYAENNPRKIWSKVERIEDVPLNTNREETALLGNYAQNWITSGDIFDKLIFIGKVAYDRKKTSIQKYQRQDIFA